MNGLKLVFLGAPGSGKGTQSNFIAETFGVTQISTGNLLRQEAKNESGLGKEIRGFIEGGQLVPDRIIDRILEDRLAREKRKGFLLDGYPRNRTQAEKLDLLLSGLRLDLDLVLNLVVDEGFLLERLTMRRVCEECSTNYHLKYQPSKVLGICDQCGGKLFQRDDDQEQTIKKRLTVFKELNSDIVDYYKMSGTPTCDIEGNGSIEQVWKLVLLNLRDCRL